MISRREFLKDVGLVTGGLVASSILPGVEGVRAQVEGQRAPKVWKNPSGNRPNILVIMVDQLRFPQGLYTQEIMDKHATNLAELRQKSVSFESNFAVAAMCTPSRSTMLTGLYTHQNGMFLTNTPIAAVPDLDPGFPTWGSILNGPDFGYNTYWWGKWHLSNNDETTPDYAQQYGFIDGGLPCPAPNTGLGRGLQGDPLTVEAFQTWLTEYTQSDAKSTPWCTTVSLTNPHDIAWYPNCTYGSLLTSVRPQPGEDLPLKVSEFDALPPNFEVWPNAGLPGNSGVPGAQGKPTLQEFFWALEELQAGIMPPNPSGPVEEKRWHQLLDLYVQLTKYVDQQIGDVLNLLKNLKDSEGNLLGLEENTIIVFTADHGEYGGSHGLRNKGFAVYEESIHVPLYVYDPTETFIPAEMRGTTRNQFTSHVDLLPLLMTLAGGGSEWRTKPQYAHLAGRADLAAMLNNPDAPGREYIISTSDEDFPDLLSLIGQQVGIPDLLIEILEKYTPRPPVHVIGYRTRTAKLGVYSYFADGTIEILQEGQQAELYNYQQDGIGEVINHSPSGSAPDPLLYASMYNALFNPGGPVDSELRQPLPNSLKQVQRRAMDNYLAFQACQADQEQCPPVYK